VGKRYTVSFAGQINGPVDLFEILAPSTAIVRLHGWEIAQTSDVGGAQEEVLRLETMKGVGAVTSGSGGAPLTPEPVAAGDPAFGGTVEHLNQTRMAAGTGTLKILCQLGWNVRLPYACAYPAQHRPVLAPGDRWTLAAPVAPQPPDILDIKATVTFEQVGG
jgi:hypothetical protein